MDDRTARALNAINRRFYTDNASSFDATRSEPWPGWTRLLPHIDTSGDAPIRVLDVGCGNGRFGAFLADAWSGLHDRVRYTGVDSSPALIARGRERALPFADTQWIEADLLQPDRALRDTAPSSFSLVVLFGVLHHVPGAALRSELLRALGGRLETGGILALATWQFGAFERFRDKVVPWRDYNRNAPEAIDIDQLETGDHLLPWKRAEGVHRYCHFASELESAELLEQTGFDVIDSYAADGRGDALNRYFICHFSNAQPAPKDGVTVR